MHDADAMPCEMRSADSCASKNRCNGLDGGYTGLPPSCGRK